MLSDYHLHSRFSFDSNEEPENICEAEIALGVTEICFTEHFEFNAPKTDIWPNIIEWNKCVDELKSKYEGRLTILQGVEIGQPQSEPERAKDLIEQLCDRLDFVIGSLHIVGNTGRPSKYEFTKKTYLEYFKMYFEELKVLAETGDFDVMGHVTFPFRYVPEELLLERPIESFEEEFREVFDIIISRNKGIEINTSGYRTPLGEAMPGEKIIKWYKEQGGNIITIGSDGHSARSAGLYIREGMDIIGKSNYTAVSSFRKRKITC